MAHLITLNRDKLSSIMEEQQRERESTIEPLHESNGGGYGNPQLND